MSSRRLFMIAVLGFGSLFSSEALAAPFGQVTVEYRTSCELKFHTHDHDYAHRLNNWLRSLGCDSHVDHDGLHYDVHFRCQRWRTRTFGCDHAAHRFENYLRGLGFKTHVLH